MKRKPWMPAREAGQILRRRDVDPVAGLSAIVRETGESGLNRLWAIANSVKIRHGATLWLNSPEIDIEAGTIVVPQRVPGRRTPEDRPEPLLINPHELDRRWPKASGNRVGGRPLNYDIEAFEDGLTIEVSKRGFPSRENEKGWRTQADVCRWAAEFLLDRQEELGDTQTKTLVKTTLESLSKK